MDDTEGNPFRLATLNMGSSKRAKAREASRKISGKTRLSDICVVIKVGCSEKNLEDATRIYRLLAKSFAGAYWRVRAATGKDWHILRNFHTIKGNFKDNAGFRIDSLTGGKAT
jgi:hypothetical protein